VPYTTSRVVTETREWKEPVTTCEIKTEKVARKVPYTVTRTVPRVIRTGEWICIPREVTEEIDVCVPRTVMKKVEIKVCRWVPCGEGCK
jgi:hypothetical protein